MAYQELQNLRATLNLFDIQSSTDFREVALALFSRQAKECEPYAAYLKLLGVEPETVHSIEQIPHLPIELFKSHHIYCGKEPAEVVFTSSSTTGKGVSRHPMSSLEHYREVFTRAFCHFYGDIKGWSIYGLLPSYLEREGSSLVYMVDRLIQSAGSGGFYLHDHQKLVDDMAADPKPKILIGVSYALWDLAEGLAPKLKDTIVMETGGMKGRREEISKQALHKILCRGLGVDKIHSEYGMAELTSQAYSKGENRFYAPPWMRVLVRDINSPSRLLKCGQRGALNIIDLANQDSCAFISTQDVGTLYDDGSFSVEGRIAKSDIRGCNLLVQ